MNILQINSSARHADSVGRDLSARLINRLNADGTATVIDRDLSAGISLLDEATVGASFTPADQRSDEQTALLAEGQALIEEIKAADQIVIAMPIYNFSAPASLKAWADLVARAGVTFQYTETGPQGLLENKHVYVVVTSGGVPIGSPMDFATGWLQTFLGFLGLTNVTVLEAGQLNTDPEAAVAAAQQVIADVALV